MKYTIEEIQKKLQKKLKSSRYIHTLGVEYTSACLAMRYGVDLHAAELAGLLHDCAKQLDPDQLIHICQSNHETISETEYRHPYLLHGKAGACLAKEKFDVSNEEILNAIRYHTTGKPEMTKLEQIVFVADYIEPNRSKAAHLDYIRELAFKDIDHATLIILDQTLAYLENNDQEIDEQTIVTRAYYKNLIGA